MTITTEQEQQLHDDVGREWGEWVRTARPVKTIVLKDAEDRMAQMLGIREVPRGGKLSLGWCLMHIADLSNMPSPRSRVPEVQALDRLGHMGRSMPGMARLVHALMVQKLALHRHRHNCYQWIGRNAEVTLFSDAWLPFHQQVLDWAMLQMPLDSLESQLGHHIKVFKTREGRLHCTDGPAVVTSAGRKLYAMFGVNMDEQDFELRGDAHRILTQVKNSEVQRALIQEMGTELFIQDSGMVPFHRDETGCLYRIESKSKQEWIRHREHLCWVHVTCPSTDRQYMLAVPPGTRTAREGVAWTFGKVPEDYHPQKET